VALASLRDREQPLPPETPQRAPMLRMLSFSEDRLGDPELTPRTIADAHHVSIRYRTPAARPSSMTTFVASAPVCTTRFRAPSRAAGRRRRSTSAGRGAASPGSGRRPLSSHGAQSLRFSARSKHPASARPDYDPRPQQMTVAT
jgi:hypothetical protein